MTSELAATLLSWAVYLSHYPAPQEPPVIKAMPHEFFVEQACGGNECRVWGWYAGGKVLYIDTTLNVQSVLGSSVVVHEMTHYLQAVANGNAMDGYSVMPSCEQVVAWEREAYGVQQAFIMSYGSYIPVGMSMARVSCGEQP